MWPCMRKGGINRKIKFPDDGQKALYAKIVQMRFSNYKILWTPKKAFCTQRWETVCLYPSRVYTAKTHKNGHCFVAVLADEREMRVCTWYRMWNLKYDSLTPKNRDKFSLTLRNLPKHLMALFSTSCRSSEKFFLCPKALPWDRILLFRFYSLTSSIYYWNNRPNFFFKTPPYNHHCCNMPGT